MKKDYQTLPSNDSWCIMYDSPKKQKYRVSIKRSSPLTILNQIYSDMERGETEKRIE